MRCRHDSLGHRKGPPRLGKLHDQMNFEDHLATVKGKIHVVNFADDFERMKSGLLYYWNLAEPLYDSAKVIWDAKGPQNVAAMLVGMSIELLLKGIHVAFDKDVPKHHRLHDLSASVGIDVNENDIIILQALSEQVIWAARYPTPRKAAQMLRTAEVFEKQRRKSGNLAKLFIAERNLSRKNCERLWKSFAGYYHKARRVRIESVELRFGGAEKLPSND